MKLFLTINGGTLAGQQFELESGFLTIGRGENCSIRFDPQSERIASKQHAFIEAKADGYYLSDNQSTNGTFLNGLKITNGKLNSGDEIQFGTNGVKATVQVEEGPFAMAPGAPAESFRDFQVSQFNQMAAQQPVSLQASLQNFGLGQLPARPEPPKTGKYIGIGLTLFALAFLIPVVAVLMFLSVGIIPAIIASIIAFVPAMLYLQPLILLDRYDPEPIWLLGLAFAWGALVAVFVSFIINTIFGVAVGIATTPALGEAAGALLSAPVFEEGSKGLGLVILLIFFRRYFDDILDGIVFAGVIALGFATVENVLYYGRAMDGGLRALGFIFVLRGILSPFAHVTFTSMTGIGCGISRESHNGFVKFIMPIVGYFGAVSLHMLWNGLAVFSLPLVRGLDIGWICEAINLSGDLEGICAFLIPYSILQIPLFLIFVGFAAFIMRRQNRILKDMLALDIARGLITPELGKTVTSALKSSAWLFSGLFAGKYRARSRYLRAAGKLGLSYWHIQRATAAQGQTGSFQQNPVLREEVLKWRDKV